MSPAAFPLYSPLHPINQPTSVPSLLKVQAKELTKPTNITPNHQNLIHRRKPKHSRNRKRIMFPITEIIAQPLANAPSCTSERQARDAEGSFSRSVGEHGVMRCGGYHDAKEVVCVVFHETVHVLRVCL